jgi:hypothetical protein
MPSGFIFKYVFIELLPRNTTVPPNIAFPDPFMNWSQSPRGGGTWQLRDSAKMFYSFHYALTVPWARWIYRGYDDVLINFDILPSYMRELDSIYNPLTDVVLRGDCVVCGPVYPQGGAGMILSRLAVEILARMSRRAIWDLPGDFDDQRLGYVLRDLKWNAGLASSSAFLGFSFGKSDWTRAEAGNFTGLSECSRPRGWESGCRRFLLSAQQIVFFHAGKDWNRQQATFYMRTRMAQHLWSAPPEIGVMRRGNQVHLCYWSDARRQNRTFNRI